MIRRPVAEYDSINGPAIYRGKTWKKPSGPPLKMSFAQADSIPEYIELHEAKVFQEGNITLNIQTSYLTRDELVLLRLIKDALPERPLYLSTGAESRLGLEPYLLTQGFVQKIMPNPVAETAETPRISGLNIDLQRTKDLWFKVYHAPDAIIKEGDWIDRPSFGIPYTYAFTGAILSEALARTGDTADAKTIVDKVRKIVKAARIEGFPID
jgi:hypothetical protein